MLKRQNATSDHSHADRPAAVATIINQQTEVPLACDHCDTESHYSLGFLRQLPQITCGFCQDSRTFSEFEMNILEKALKQMGFYLAG